MATKSRDEIEQALASLDNWTLDDGGASISRSFKFKTFPEAISFMVRIGFICEEMNHHPDWANYYNRVEVTLTTHDTGSVTDNDLKLAAKMDDIMWR